MGGTTTIKSIPLGTRQVYPLNYNIVERADFIPHLLQIELLKTELLDVFDLMFHVISGIDTKSEKQKTHYRRDLVCSTFQEIRHAYYGCVFILISP